MTDVYCTDGQKKNTSQALGVSFLSSSNWSLLKFLLIPLSPHITTPTSMNFINFIKFIYYLLPNFDMSVDLKVWVALFIATHIWIADGEQNETWNFIA